MDILEEPTVALQRWNRRNLQENWDEGQLALALELESYKRRILSLPGTSLLALSSQELATAIDTFLGQQGLAEPVLYWYNLLLKEQQSERVVGFEPT